MFKRVFASVLVFVVAAATCMAAQLPYEIKTIPFPAADAAFNVPSADGWLFAWGTSVPSAEDGYAKGCLFLHTDATGDNDRLYINTGTATSCTFSAVYPGCSGGVTLDGAYDYGGAGSGKAVTVDSGAVALTNNAANNNGILAVTKNPSGAQSGDAVSVTVGATATGAGIAVSSAGSGAGISLTPSGSGAGLTFTNSGTGNDVTGTSSTWSVTKAGAATFASLSAGTVYQTAITAAASGNQNLTIDAAGNGTITLGNTSTGLVNLNREVTMDGNVTLGDASADTITVNGTVISNITMDDGTTDSPTLTLQDATNETAALVKVDGDNLTLTTAANRGLEVVTGNLFVGNGAPGTAAMDGEDFYVNGDSEFDGSVQFDGAVTAASTLAGTTISVSTLLDVNEDIDIDFDANDEEMVVSTSATDYAANGAVVRIETTGAGATNATYLLELKNAADGDAQDHFLRCIDNAAGGPDEMFKVTAGGAVTAAGTVTAPTVNVTTLLDVDEDVDVDFDANDEEVNITTAANDYAADAAVVTVYDNVAGGQTNATYLMRLRHKADGDAQDHFIACEDNDGDDMFTVNSGGAVMVTGDLDVNGAIVGDGGGAMYGMLRTVTVDADAMTVAIGDAQKVVLNTGQAGAGVKNLPEASTAHGMEITFVVTENGQNLNINPDDADQILGLTNAAGDSIQSSTLGNTVTLLCVTDGYWVVKGYYGTWTDAN